MRALRARHNQLNHLLARQAIRHMPDHWKARMFLRAQVIDLDWYRRASGSQVDNHSQVALELARNPHVPSDAVNPFFSADWYRSRTGVQGTTGDALLHYLLAGEAAGATPGPWFDPAFFRRFNHHYHRYGSLLGAYMNGWGDNAYPHPHFDGPWYVWRYPDVGRHWPRSPLDHFVRTGLAEGREPNMGFSARWYQHTYADVAASGVAPALHFASAGAAELRSPGPNFDMRGYQAAYPDQIGSGLDPLAHFLRIGREQGRRGGTRYTELSELLAIEPDPQRARAPAGVVDVIVPVYRDLAVTRDCIESLLASVPRVRTPVRIRLCNDASPEPVVTAYLREVAATHEVLLTENADNRGFVATVNAAMRSALAAPDCVAVLLLNSDTQVNDDWVDRLHAHAADPSVGTVTALSNNATICSYPSIAGHGLPRHDDVASLDAAAALSNAGRAVDIPTAVGFCMLITRDCLQRTGLFDEDAFGRGYGEENDFCMRASALGLRHVLATDVFVHHVGEVSFAGDSAPGKQAAGAVIRQRYPDYEGRVARHCAQDPARNDRIRLTFARWRAGGRPVTVLCTHDLGGGTERQVQKVATELRASGHAVVMRPAWGHKTLVRFENTDPDDAFEFVVDPRDSAGLAMLLREMGATDAQVHHLYDHSVVTREALALAGLPYSFDVHDYFVVCPQITLTTPEQEYCGEPAPAGCDSCIAQRPALGASDIRNWRLAHEWTVLGASRVRAPSVDTARRIERHFGRMPDVVAHEADAPVSASDVQRRTRPITAQAPLRVVLIGVLSLTKGRRKVYEAIEASERLGLSMHFHVIGDPQDTRPDVGDGRFTYTGWYRPEELPRLIDDAQADLYLFASAAPETYSFALTEAMQQRRPIIATDLGAFAERLRGYPDHVLFPHGTDGTALAQRIWAFGAGDGGTR